MPLRASALEPEDEAQELARRMREQARGWETRRAIRRLMARDAQKEAPKPKPR